MALRGAYTHMDKIANPLTDAIAAQFPDKYGADVGPRPALMPDTGAELPSTATLLVLGALAAASGIVLVRRTRRSA